MANINGTPGNDLIYGTTAGDVIRTFEGFDTVYGGPSGGISAQTGPDLIYGNQDNDDLHGQDGSDTVYGGQGNDEIDGGFGDDVVYGNFGADSVKGDDGSDPDSSDTLYGGLNNDELYGGDSDDVIYGNLGDDSLHGQDHNDRLYGGQQNDELSGGGEDDVIYGNSGADTLTGGGLPNKRAFGDDTLYGGQDNDLLVAFGYEAFYGGNVGDHDHLFGNRGSDTFDFSNYNANRSGTTDANSNRIMDFATGVDKFKATTDTNSPEYTEVAAPDVTSVAEAITFSDENDLFDNTGSGNIDYVFIAGATHGYLIVNVNSDSGDFRFDTDYAVVIQNANTLAAFSVDDIINNPL